MAPTPKEYYYPGTIIRSITLILLALWMAAQPLAVIASVPYEFRFELFFWKNLLGAIFVCYSLFVIAANLALKKYPIFDSKLLAVGLLFPTYALFNLLFRDSLTSWDEQVLYTLWVLAIFLVFPALLPTEADRHRALLVILITNLIVLAYGMALGFANEPFDQWLNLNYRLDFDFINPLIFAASWQIVVPICLYFLVFTNSRWKRLILGLLILIALFFVVQARARSNTLFCLGVLGSVFLINGRPDARLRLAALCFCLAILVSFLGNLDLNYESINDLSSGRLLVWSRNLEFNFDNPSIVDYLTGRVHLVAGNPLSDGSRMGFQASRAQADNVYLALFLQHGLIGSLLFYTPLIILLSRFIRSLKLVSGQEKRLYGIAIGIWTGLFIQMATQAPIPSFGNVINIFLLIFMAHPLVASKELLEQAPDKSSLVYPKVWTGIASRETR